MSFISGVHTAMLQDILIEENDTPLLLDKLQISPEFFILFRKHYRSFHIEIL